MPQTQKEKLLFSLLMSIFMVYGMETYNHMVINNSFSFSAFLINPIELVNLVIIVIILETFIGGPLARKTASYFYKDHPSPLLMILLIQVCTVFLMCPMMSLVATILLKGGLSSELLSIWLHTFATNIMMALVWQLAVAGPIVRKIALRTVN